MDEDQREGGGKTYSNKNLHMHPLEDVDLSNCMCLVANCQTFGKILFTVSK